MKIFWPNQFESPQKWKRSYFRNTDSFISETLIKDHIFSNVNGNSTPSPPHNPPKIPKLIKTKTNQNENAKSKKFFIEKRKKQKRVNIFV